MPLTVLSHACEILGWKCQMEDRLRWLWFSWELPEKMAQCTFDARQIPTVFFSWEDKKYGIYNPDIILSLKSPLFGYPATYSSSVTRNRKRTKGWLRPNRRRSRVTACRSDRHAFETPYVVNSGVHHRWTNNFVDMVEHLTPGPLDHSFVWRARVPCSGIVACRRSYSIALRSICTGLLFIRSCDESKVQRREVASCQPVCGRLA